MRTVVGLALVGIFVSVACGGSSDEDDGQTKGGAGSVAGTPGVGGSNTTAGKPAGGSDNAAGSSTTDGGTAPEGGSATGGSAPGGSATGGDSLGGAPSAGAPSEVAGAGGEAIVDGGAAGAADQGGAGGGSNGPDIDCACDAGEACIKVTVTRDPDTTSQPWVLWPAQTDGVGTLTVTAAAAGTGILERVTIPSVSFVAADAVLGVAVCLPPGATRVRAFLDEVALEPQNVATSSHYLDSCAPGAGACFRCYDLTTTANAEVDLTIALKHSCD